MTVRSQAPSGDGQQLIRPVSRYSCMKSLKYYTRFVIRLQFPPERIIHLPIPNELKKYLLKSPYFDPVEDLQCVFIGTRVSHKTAATELKEIVKSVEMSPPVAGTQIEDLWPKWLVEQEMQELAPECFFQKAEIVFVLDESPFVANQPDQCAEA
ncbi:unnamed protein product [Clavelina lepadiformis]|uniref:SOCS box domain-containing protein n=1 Tax=Clavelina lepadiformis TaxID=159417 RepID=A0ABP0GJY4_CLALP